MQSLNGGLPVELVQWGLPVALIESGLVCSSLILFWLGVL
jgi:hypothetical protein